MKIILSILIIFGSCSFKKSPLKNQKEKGHKELYSHPSSLDDVPQGYKRIIIAATNDVKGHFAPSIESFKDDSNENKQSFSLGGVDAIHSYFKILKELHPNSLLLDSGDVLSPKSQDQKTVQQFYKSANYDAITLGLSDFNLSIPKVYKSHSDFIKNFAHTAKTPLVLSNLYELKTARTIEWDGVQPYLIKEIDGIKIGIMGLISDDIVKKSSSDIRIGLYVENMLESTLRTARLMRSLGAELIVVLTHQGLACGEKMAQETGLDISKVNFEPEKTDACNLNSSFGQYLNRLPINLVDLIIGGQTYTKMVNYINGTLVLSAFPKGKGFSLAEFFFNQETGKIARQMTKAHQPIFFCRDFFKQTNDCYHLDKSVDHRDRIPAVFLEKMITLDNNLLQKFITNADLHKSNLTPSDLVKAIQHSGAELGFKKLSQGYGKLNLIQIKGSFLKEILEKDYNIGRSDYWHPNPFQKSNDKLILTVNDGQIILENNYTLLIDQEDLVEHASLWKTSQNSKLTVLTHSSWLNPESRDEVSIQLSSSDQMQ